MLTDEQIAGFSETGFVVLENVFSPGEIESLIEATNTDVIRKDLKLRQSDEYIAHLLELTTKHDAFKALACDSRLTGRVAALIGEDLQLQHSKLATKPRRAGVGEFAWHQDFPRFPHTNYDLVAVSVLLDDATPENGGLYALEGSHKLGPRGHEKDGWMVGPCYEKHLWETAPEKIVPMMASAGGVIIHHCLLLHFSPATRNGASRRIIAFEYRAGDALQLANNIWADTGFQVHGKPGGRVRCETLELRLPRDPAWLRYCGNVHGDVFNQIGPVARAWNEES